MWKNIFLANLLDRKIAPYDCFALLLIRMDTSPNFLLVISFYCGLNCLLMSSYSYVHMPVCYIYQLLRYWVLKNLQRYHLVKHLPNWPIKWCQLQKFMTHIVGSTKLWLMLFLFGVTKVTVDQDLSWSLSKLP